MTTISPGPDPQTASRLLETQRRLQGDAEAVLADLDLATVLRAAGRPVRVGSSVSGLMAWRDIDFNILCRTVRPSRIWTAMHPLADHPRVRKLRWSNEIGPFNSTGRPESEGGYLGIHYHEGGTIEGSLWKIDCWFLPEGIPRPEMALLNRLARDLDDETRVAILWIKETWATRPEYRHGVYSVDIYEAVLDHGVRSPDEFTVWLRARSRS